jgi:hypothetical protein
MSRVDLFNGVKIVVESTGRFFHSYDDWGLYIANTDYIGEPKQYTRYIEIPGRNGLLDLSEAISGRQIYTSREIKISLAGRRDKTDWDGVISAFRNEINGKVCLLIFDNDLSHYWRGRIEIKDFSSVLNLGKFVIDVPNADPYKYSLTSSAEPWLWDPFNFETDMVTYIGAITVSGSITVTIPHGHMATSPELVVSDMTSQTFTITVNGVAYPLVVGTNRIPSIIIGGDADVDLTFTGDAKVQIVYRSGSL